MTTGSSIEFEKELITTLTKAKYKYSLCTVNELTEEQARSILAIVDNLRNKMKNPVVHAEWEHKDGIYGVAYCSNCDFELKYNNTNYCPNCGAKMDKSGMRSLTPEESKELKKYYESLVKQKVKIEW
ncbi:MAG: hypothetical protein KBS82_05085 [Oscillospiraceae bacterium]|nr:hypothetical protein [Candidatus Limimonas egerieequi]